MVKTRIGIFDSGLGGISVLKEMIKIMPNMDYVYYGDTLNNPYGSKSYEELCKITSGVVEFLKSKGCKIIVIACNTATVVTRKYLEEKYPDIIFIGTVPAVKVACDMDFKKILVLATPKTIESERISELVYNFKKDEQEIILAPCKNLAGAIESFDSDQIDLALLESVKEYLDKEVDAIVLGCTHYVFIKEKIEKLFPGVKLIDGNKGVSLEVKRKLNSENILTDNTSCGRVDIYNSKDENLVKKYYELLESGEVK